MSKNKKNTNKGGVTTKKVTTTTTTVVEETIIEKRPGKTYYAFVVDRSGSMGSIKKETIDNFNEQIGTLKALQEKYPEEQYYVTLCLFDHEINTIYKDKPLNEVEKLNDETYIPRGSTSLHDAIGFTISDLKERNRKELNEKENEALIVILTDGYENTSKEWNGKKVANLIQEVDKKENWTVSFIGASKESALQASQTLGIANTTYVDTSNSVAYTNSTAGISNALYARGYAKSKGATAKATYFAATVNDSGQLTNTLNYQELDRIIEEQTATKENKNDTK